MIEAGKWQSIETAPRDGTFFLLSTAYSNGRHCMIEVASWNESMKAWESGGYEWKEGDLEDDYPTHWMPLPQPPIGE